MDLWYMDLEYLHSLPIFFEWEKGEISQFLINAEKVKYNLGESVYKEGDKPDYLYIIKEGECEVTKEIKSKGNEKIKSMRVFVENVITARKTFPRRDFWLQRIAFPPKLKRRRNSGDFSE